ncbi:MAG: helix-turn-helix transcriptional regulator [Eggerthellaceae bacterium]|nr:helix-turn-helix transcriptional regulator [Eggerthellaceae bacterium]
MSIVVHLDRLLLEKRMSSKELACRIGISENNLSKIRTGNIRAIRFSTLEAICRELNCAPGDLLEYIDDQSADTPSND